MLDLLNSNSEAQFALKDFLNEKPKKRGPNVSKKKAKDFSNPLSELPPIIEGAPDRDGGLKLKRGPSQGAARVRKERSQSNNAKRVPKTTWSNDNFHIAESNKGTVHSTLKQIHYTKDGIDLDLFSMTDFTDSSQMVDFDDGANMEGEPGASPPKSGKKKISKDQTRRMLKACAEGNASFVHALVI